MGKIRKLAVLILAHKDVDQLNRLIVAMQHPDVDIYVHIDVKRDASFRKRVKTGCWILPDGESENITWGDIGMPRATIKLMRHAAGNADYEHMLLISGQDYPVRPISALLDRIDGCGDFLDIVGGSQFESRYALYYPQWMIGKGALKRPFRGFYKYLGMGPLKGLLQRKGLPSGRYYSGSSWWILRGVVADWILREIDREPIWLAFYSNSLNPDEGLFQTIYMNSPFAGQNEGILTYIDWSSSGPSPEVLTKKDYESIVRSGKFFARKMESGVSDDLLDQIDGAIERENERVIF